MGKGALRYLDTEDQFSNCDISVISVVLRETTLTISDSIVEPDSIESDRMMY